MSRKLVTLFKNIGEQVHDSSNVSLISHYNYIIDLKDKRDWLTNSILLCETECLPHKIVAIFKYNSEYYITIPEKEDNSSSFFQYLDTNVDDDNSFFKDNPGILTFIWSQIKKYLKHDNDELDIINYIFRNSSPDMFECNYLQRFFNEFIVWKLDKNQLNILPNETDKKFLKSLSFQIYGSYFCDYKKLLSLKFSTEAITTYKTIFYSFGHLICIPVFNSITSTNWEHCFLELYRCIERLFGFPVIKDVANHLNPTLLVYDIDEIIEIIEKRYNIRPDEEKAFISLLKLPICNSVVTTFASEYDITTIDKKAEKVAQKIYSCRNSIVHWRKAIEEQSLVIDNKMINYIGDFVFQLYTEFGRNIN